MLMLRLGSADSRFSSKEWTDEASLPDGSWRRRRKREEGSGVSGYLGGLGLS